MEKYSWTYCLNDDQYKKLYRIICKVPGLSQYLEENNGRDFKTLVSSFKMHKEYVRAATPGIRVNLELLMSRYDMFRKEYDNTVRTKNPFPFDFNLYQILTWIPKPKWAECMSIEEIDYLDHFIPLVVGLPEFLHKNTNQDNLYDLVVSFQLSLNATGKNDSEKNFVLETIKERFYRLMEDHEDAIHYVNHSQQIDDHKILDQFHTEATNLFYTNDINSIDNDFVNKYVKFYHPYIASEIFLRFLRANKVSMALNFAHKAFFHTFSSPIIYWHNKEAIYGSVNILNNILEALGYRGILKLKENNPKLATALLETIYLLLSRIIYWSDKETHKDEKYDESTHRIGIQHKIRAYRLRANLLETCGNYFTNYNQLDLGKMCVADLFSAHFLANRNKIVGVNSVFKRDAERLFHIKELYKTTSPEKASEDGFQMNDRLAMSIHENYKDGKYSLTEKEISELTGFLRVYFKEEYRFAIHNNLPISYLEKDNFSPSYKPQRDVIKQYLQQNGIIRLYHFTEKDKIQSIIKYGGLLSYKRCLDEGIVMPVREGMALSRDIDARLDLEDYVRLSFCSRLPKIKERQKEGAELVMLHIDIDVALFDETLYTDIEATHIGMHQGKGFDDLKKVNLQSTQKKESSPSDSDYWQRQAEVLVKGFVPLHYITNIKNPEKLS